MDARGAISKHATLTLRACPRQITADEWIRRQYCPTCGGSCSLHALKYHLLRSVSSVFFIVWKDISAIKARCVNAVGVNDRREGTNSPELVFIACLLFLCSISCEFSCVQHGFIKRSKSPAASRDRSATNAKAGAIEKRNRNNKNAASALSLFGEKCTQGTDFAAPPSHVQRYVCMHASTYCGRGNV